MRLCKILVMLALILGTGFSADAQSERRKKLEQQKVRIQDELTLANKILEETKENKETTLNQIQTFEKKIELRETLLRTLNRELELINEDIAQLNDRVDTLEAELQQQLEYYASMIREARRSQSTTSRLMFLLSAEDFNQAIKRLEYLKQFSKYRRRQIKTIEDKRSALNSSISDLKRQKERKIALRKEMKAEQEKLLAEKKEQEEQIDQYKEREEKLSDEIAAKEKRSDKLEKEIQRLIALEIKRAKEAAKRRNIEDEAIELGLVRGKDFTTNTSNERLKELIEQKRREAEAQGQEVAASTEEEFSLTPEAKQLAANFSANKNRLPWPVEKGLVVSKFGKQRHPVAKSVIINNNGIDIATEPGSVARASFDGTVSNVIRIPGESLAVLVRHGNYFTIYKNLSRLFVKAGDEVKRGQKLGVVYTDETQNKTVLHFEVWNDLKVMDPLLWLVDKG